MANQVDFKTVVTTGLETSPVAAALAGLRANEARYYWHKYQQPFLVATPEEDPETLSWIEGILAERDLRFASRPLEVAHFTVAGIKFAEAFYQSGLAVNVMYTVAAGGKRAVGFKLAEGMPIPAELVGRFKFARQKSKLAGTIRGSYFVIKGEH